MYYTYFPICINDKCLGEVHLNPNPAGPGPADFRMVEGDVMKSVIMVNLETMVEHAMRLAKAK